MLKTLAKFGLAALAVATISGGAFAQSSYTTPLVNFSDVSSLLGGSFSLPGFDPSLGTLTGVTLNENVTSQIYIKLTDDGTPATFSSASAQLYVFDGVNNINTPITLTIPHSTTTAFRTIASSATDYFWEATVTPTYGKGPAVPSLGGSVSFPDNSSIVISPADYSDFLGNTPILFYPGVNVTGTGLSSHLGISGGGEVSGSMSVTYDYTPSSHTPEPGSVALLLAGGTTVFAGLRRRRSLKK